MNDSDDSFPIGPKQPCPCGTSSDAYQLYSDGHHFCYRCQSYFPPDDDDVDRVEEEDQKPRTSGLVEFGDLHPLRSRKISEDTCRKYGYTVQKYKGQDVQVAHYRDTSGSIVAQKLRFPDKTFKFLGDTKEAGLYGQHLYSAGGKTLVITEGEIDALSVAQVFSDSSYAVVSIPNGSSGATKAIGKNLEWVQSFEEVILCFDNDEAGQEATEKCARMFKAGKAKIAKLSFKDPNEYLQQDEARELRRAIWNAEEHRPDGIVSVADILEMVTLEPEEGLPWFLPALTDATYGRRTGECVALGAGTGVGKTDFIVQQVAYDIFELEQKVAVFAFESSPRDIVKRVLGKQDGVLYHVPGGYDVGQLDASVQHLSVLDRLYLYDHFGSCDWDSIVDRIRFLAHAHDVKLFYIDHLTALAAMEEDERKALERMMAELGGLIQELDIWVLFVSHLATPDGKPHEEGGRVAIRHFKGSRSIGFWAHFMIGIERDQQDDDEASRHKSTYRILKDRLTGQSTGRTIDVRYDQGTGRLSLDSPFSIEEDNHDF